MTDDWSPAKRIVFRFVFSYILLCVVPFPFSSSPGSIVKTDVFDKLWFAVASWVGSNVLHTAPTPAYANRMLADTVAGYVTLLCFALLAGLATIVWTALDGKRRHYRTLHEWLRMYVRYALALTMLAYGMDKVFALQFRWSAPGPGRLAEPLRSRGIGWPHRAVSSRSSFRFSPSAGLPAPGCPSPAHARTRPSHRCNTITLANDDGSTSAQGDGPAASVLAYARPDSAHLELRGTLDGQTVAIVMRQVDTAKFTLVSRRFHWIENGGFYR